MKRRVVKIMTILLFLFFLIMMSTGVAMRLGWEPESIQEIHGICGMIFILLVFYHWHLFGRMFINMLRSPEK